jgi:hypothetical protein
MVETDRAIRAIGHGMVWPQWTDALIAVFSNHVSDLNPLTDTEDVSVILNEIGDAPDRNRDLTCLLRSRTTL